MGAYGIQMPSGAGAASQQTRRFVPNSELVEREQEEPENEALVTGLENHLQKLWEAARHAKEPQTERMLKCLRQRKGFYEPDILHEIREQGGSEIFVMLTDTKCRSAVALIRDVILPLGEEAWTIEPTPIPDLSPEMQQAVMVEAQMYLQQQMQAGAQIAPAQAQMFMESVEDQVKKKVQKAAEESAEAMQELIKDQMAESDFREQVSAFIDYLCTYPTAFFYGPDRRKKKSLKWVKDEMGNTVPQVEEEIGLTSEAINPLDFFPAPFSKTVQDGYCFIHRMLSLSRLTKMRGMPGYNAEVIETIISEYWRGGLREWMSHDTERAFLEGRPSEYLYATDKIASLQFFGELPGHLLVEWGVEGIDDPHEVYAVEAWKIGRYVFKAVLNDDPLGRVPVYEAGIDPVADSIWGKNALPELIRDDQQMCNGAARALANNMGIASGPQVVVNDISRLPQGEDVEQIYPWRVWQFGADETGATGHRPPVEFFQPSSNAEELLRVLEFWLRRADEDSGVPAYTYGDNDRLGGAGDTASGLSMLMGQASKMVKKTVADIDRFILERVVRRYFTLNMLDPRVDPKLKGDVQIVARGATSMFIKEQQQMRRIEFLGMTANDYDMQIMGQKGRAALLREVARSHDMGVSEIVPDNIDEELPSPEEQALQQQLQELTAQHQEVIQKLESKTAEISAKYEADERKAASDHERAMQLEEQKAELEKEIEEHKARIQAELQQSQEPQAQVVAQDDRSDEFKERELRLKEAESQDRRNLEWVKAGREFELKQQESKQKVQTGEPRDTDDNQTSAALERLLKEIEQIREQIAAQPKEAAAGGEPINIVINTADGPKNLTFKRGKQGIEGATLAPATQE